MLTTSNSALSISSNFSNATSAYAYEEAIEEIKGSGLINLARIQELSYTDLGKLFEEIKRWSVYGDHDLKKLTTTAQIPNL